MDDLVLRNSMLANSNRAIIPKKSSSNPFGIDLKNKKNVPKKTEDRYTK